MKEVQLRRLWQERAWGRAPLATADGRKLKILHTGTPGESAGPDFVAAVFQVEGGGVETGDVELHMAGGGWRAHGHHRDPAYNGVRLHVLWGDAGWSPQGLEEGSPTPSLLLSEALRGLSRASETASPPCLGAAAILGEERLATALGRAGERRFREKGEQFAAAMRRESPLEVLYQGIMEALGYSANQEPFTRLARGRPVAGLVAYSQGMTASETERAFQGALLGGAGLLPSQRGLTAKVRDSEEVAALERAWQDFCTGQAGPDWGETHQKEKEGLEWDLKVRPHNHPVRRLAGAAVLFARHKDEELIDHLGSLLYKNPQGAKGIERALEVEASGYWGRHWDFGKPLAGRAPALIGEDRARVAVANIVLPFLWAWGVLFRQPATARLARRAYTGQAPPQEDRIVRHMRAKLGVRSSKGLGAAHQQGMHQIYRGRCVLGRCGGCPIKRALDEV